ncbi:MAG: glycosyltransferase family 39 protein, partial [Lishizhenia sp.]
YTQYSFLPLLQNPASAGFFDANMRFSGIYRNQWASVPVNYNSVGFSSYYQRPPGYGFLFFIAHSISNSQAFLILKIIQILLFGFSIYLFGKTLEALKIKDKIVLFATIAYGILPFFSTFTYFALTESILPFILISTLYFTLQFNEKQSIKSVFILGAWIGFALLIRPQVGFLILPALFFLIRNFNRLKLHLLLFLTLTVLPFLSWNIRNYTVNQEWVGIHPIYHYSNNHMYRPIHQNMSDLFRIWESNSATFHSNMAILFRDTTAQSRNIVLQTIPKKIDEKYAKELNTCFIHYQKASYALRKNFKRSSYIKKNDLVAEVSAKKSITLLTTKIKTAFWFTNYVTTPILALKEFVESSHLGLFIYQSTFRGNPIMEIFRWSAFLFLLGLLIFSLIATFISSLNKTIRVTLLAAFLYLFYLIYFQRMNEERYYYILLPLFFVGSLTLLNHFFNRKRSS